MNNDLLTIIKQLSEEYVGILVFSDVAGIKELQIKVKYRLIKHLRITISDE